MVHVNAGLSPFWRLSPMWLQFDSPWMPRPGPSQIGIALRKAREKTGLSQEKLADKAGTSRQQISRLEKDARKLTRDWAERLAPHLAMSAVDLEYADQPPTTRRAGMIPILGETAAGRWIEIDTSADEPREWLPFLPEPEMSTDGLYALRVRGNSMDAIAPDGSIVICRSLASSGFEISEEDYVVIERLRHQEGLREVTLKQVRRTPRGGVELIPRSSDKRWKPVTYSGQKQADALDLRIIATVEFIVLPIGRRARKSR